MVDITASNETFNVDKTIGADLVKIMTPDGNVSRLSSTYKRRCKSVADYFLKESGTYKITNNSNTAYMTSYKTNGDRKKLCANKLELRGKLPEGAKKI